MPKETQVISEIRNILRMVRDCERVSAENVLLIYLAALEDIERIVGTE